MEIRAFAPVLTAMPGQGIGLGDILSDSGYAYRDADAWAIPVRAADGQLVQDLHPNKQRPQGHPPRRHHRQRQPVLPGHPRTLTALGPLARDATPEQADTHDQQTAETAPCTVTGHLKQMLKISQRWPRTGSA